MKFFFRLLLLVFVFVPIIWGIRTSLLDNHFENSIIPTSISFRSYAEFLRPGSNFWNSLKNSFITGIGTIFLLVPIVILAAYALGRIQFKGRDIGKIILYLPLIPSIVLLTSLGRIINNMNLMNNLFAVILLNTIFMAPFTTWILRNFVKGISPSLDEASVLDGCGRIRTLIFIILPNILPGLITVIVYIFIQSWLIFLYAYTVINSARLMVIPQLVQSFLGVFGSDYTVLCTFSIISLIPPLIFFIFFQKWFILGLFGHMSK
jgi:ABC-type glycerol-3-phosphate transport system permease component